MSNDSKLILLQERLDNHISDYEKRCEQDDGRWNKLLDSQIELNEAIRKQAESTDKLCTETEDLLKTWNAVRGTTVALAAVGKFIKWVSTIAIVAGIADWIARHWN